MRHLGYAAIVSGLICAFGCGNRDTQLERSVTVVGVEALGTDLAYVQSTGVLQRVNVMANAPMPETTKTSIRSGPRLLAKRPAPMLAAVPEELLVLSDGITDNHGQVLDAPALTAIGADNAQRVYELSQPGQRMSLSQDGTYAVLFDDPQSPNSNSLLTNRNEIAIVDLSTNPSGVSPQNPVIRTLDAVGGTPQALWFANLKIGKFMLFSFPKGLSLSLIDVPDDRGHKIELGSWVPSASSGLAPIADVVADPDANQIYLRNGSSPDVQVISVAANADVPGSLDVSQNTLTVGSAAPTDFRVYSQPDATQPDLAVTRLVATVGSFVSVVAADSNTVTSVPLTYSANRILPFKGIAPKDDAIKQRAVVYAVGQSGLTFVDLEDLELKTTKSLQAVDLGATLSSVLELPTLPNTLLLFMQSGGVEILDLQTRRWSPIGSSAMITATIADPSQVRSWLAVPGSTQVGYLDFSNPLNMSIGGINLDDPLVRFFRIDSGTVKKVIATHNHVGGSLTIFDAVNPERPTARKLEGFLLSNLL